MHKIKDVLRLKLDVRPSHEQIATALRVSKGAVATKYAGLTAAAGIDWTTANGMDEAALERRLLTKPAKRSAYALPDYGRIHQELQEGRNPSAAVGRIPGRAVPLQ